MRDELIRESAKFLNRQYVEYDGDPLYGGGIALFSYLKGETLEKLVKSGFASFEDQQNDAPTLGEFLEFLKNNPDFSANGYAVEESRPDCRITITGLDFAGEYNQDQKEKFLKFSKGASEIDVLPNKLRSWWD